MENKKLKKIVIGVIMLLYIVVSGASTIHSIEFFQLTNPSKAMAIFLAAAFELGAAASLGGLLIMDKKDSKLLLTLFTVITLVQVMGNMFFGFVHAENFSGWSELMGLMEEPVILQKRILAAIQGGILPLIALGFIHFAVNKKTYEKSEESEKSESSETPGEENKVSQNDVKIYKEPKTEQKQTEQNSNNEQKDNSVRENHETTKNELIEEKPKTIVDNTIPEKFVEEEVEEFVLDDEDERPRGFSVNIPNNED